MAVLQIKLNVAYAIFISTCTLLIKTLEGEQNLSMPHFLLEKKEKVISTLVGEINIACGRFSSSTNTIMFPTTTLPQGKGKSNACYISF